MADYAQVCRCVLQVCPHTLSLQADDIFQNVRSQLARLAVFVEQARLDERRHVPDQRVSLHDDLLRLEEEGIYNILCGLQVRINWRYVSSQCHATQQTNRIQIEMVFMVIFNQSSVTFLNYTA